METEKRLKYLEFLLVAALHMVVKFTSLYLFAKDMAGPLKWAVEAVEGTVKTVVGPVYNKFHDVPVGLLKFVDRKVDESVTRLHHLMPSVVNKVSAQAFSAAQRAPVAAQAVASEVQRASETASEFAKTVFSKVEPKAKELYTKYEPKTKVGQFAVSAWSKLHQRSSETASALAETAFSKYKPKAKELYIECEPKTIAEQFAVSAWSKLNQLPLFPQVAQVMVPTAVYFSEMYNQTVFTMAEKGCKVFSYFPLVPSEKIAQVFKHEASKSAPSVSS